MKIALRIEVATLSGARRAAPRLAALLKEHRARATFLFNLGPDRTGRAWGSLPPVSRLRCYGWRALLSGTLLPAPDVGQRCADRLRALAQDGHEAGILAFDRADWVNRIADADETWTAAAMQRARERYEEIFGTAALTHGAPGWRMNRYAYRYAQRLGFRHCSDTRGTGPFIPIVRGEIVACPQLPTTLPTLDGLPLVKPPFSRMTAYDMNAGTIAWQVPMWRLTRAMRAGRRRIDGPAPAFVERVTAPLLAGEGNLLPVSALPPDGTFPVGTARFEKRGIARALPAWDPELCIDCGKCAIVCPHAAIRMKVFEPAALSQAPEGFARKEFKSRDLPGHLLTIQVAPDDCTGCAVCVDVCPVTSRELVSHKAINMEPVADHRDRERTNFAYFLDIPELDAWLEGPLAGGVRQCPVPHPGRLSGSQRRPHHLRAASAGTTVDRGRRLDLDPTPHQPSRSAATHSCEGDPAMLARPLLAAALMMTTGAALAAQERRPIEAEDLYRLRTASNVAVSPTRSWTSPGSCCTSAGGVPTYSKGCGSARPIGIAVSRLRSWTSRTMSRTA